MTEQFVVKRRSLFNGNEATSVVAGPMDREGASVHMAFLNVKYQTPGNYYIEKWEPRS